MVNLTTKISGLCLIVNFIIWSTLSYAQGKPCQNFYQSINYDWLDTHPVPDDKERWSIFDEVAQNNERKLQNIMQTAVHMKEGNLSRAGQLVATFYNSGLDTQKIEALGYQPLQPLLGQINKMQSTEDLVNVLAQCHLRNISILFDAHAMPDLYETKHIILYLSETNLSLPSLDDYLSNTKRAKQIRKLYKAHVAAVFKLLGESAQAADENAEIVLSFETALADAHEGQYPEPEKNYHPMSQAQLDKFAPDFPWQSYFKAIGIMPIQKISLVQKYYFLRVAGLTKRRSLAEWRVFLTWKVTHYAAPYLSEPFRNTHFDFFSKELTGQKQQTLLRNRMADITSQVLRQVVGQLYIQKYYSQEQRDNIRSLAEALKATLYQRLVNLPWLGEKTREQALTKLARLTFQIGYPTVQTDGELKLENKSFFANIMQANAYYRRREFARVGQTQSRYEWVLSPQDVNAYYDVTHNTVVIPAGFTQTPLYDFKGSLSSQYAGLGVIIAHEIIHGFDTKGVRFNADGTFIDWWMPEDIKLFHSKTACLLKQLNDTKIAGHPLSSELMGREAIADLGGLLIARQAFQAAIQKQYQNQAGQDEALTMFYRQFAKTWAMSIRPKALSIAIQTDRHPPSQVRVNLSLAHDPEFIRLYQCEALKKSICKIW